jgi:hypothetical protein
LRPCIERALRRERLAGAIGRGGAFAARRSRGGPTVPNVANSAGEAGGKKSLKERAIGELEKYAVISVYLWLLFSLFSLHKQLVQGHGISAWQQGFAIVNALVFGKVVLLGEALELGRGREGQTLAYVVLRKALIFAVLLVVFHLLEEAVRAWFEGQPTSDALAGFGGSTAGVVSYAGIFFVVLIPFYAFQETARVLGGDALWRLFFRPRVHGIRLVEDLMEG